MKQTLRKIWEWLTLTRTERIILFIASKGHTVHFYHRTQTQDGQHFITIAVGANTIRVNRKEGIYRALKTIAKFSIEKV